MRRRSSTRARVVNNVVEDFIDKAKRVARIAAKRRWLALGVAAGVAVACGVGITVVPDRFEASARIYVDTRVMAGPHQVGAAPGPVPADQIEQLRDRFVAAPGLASLQRALNQRRLVVLVGPEGSGRSTTGLWLLDECTGGTVSQLFTRTTILRYRRDT